ncbi:transcription factor IIIA [Canna indica]|uniref:Transcription factor IIIA n=1 Tax=Canna indica TaxID=4628 RepID=A0AAQ3K7P9_9LILI|nr:transcription factor IIIA [Canna indica]
MDSAESHSLVDESETSIDECVGTKEKPASRDIRRYYCQYCGICRSKKKLIASHILTCHKDELENAQSDEVQGVNKQHTCQECGASFRKPAHLKQHMQSHATERPFTCPVDDCHASYKRKDHLTRHLLTHEGKLFDCPVNNCNRKFSIKANMKKHVTKIHEDEVPCEGHKQYVCNEPGCGKTFKYPSKLMKHEGSHVKLDYVEVVCYEPGCMKTFTNTECLKAHIRTSHQHVDCEACGTKQLKKNFKRHERMHVASEATGRIQCNFKGCECSFSNTSNLRQHIKAVHHELRPFACRFSGCGQKFTYKHVRDNHEKSGVHVYVEGDFLETDEYLHSQPRGGRKRKQISVETFQRKRVVPPDQASVLDDGIDYLRWLLSGHEE